jgi:tungstate transport system substrate-binding protein
MVFAWSGTMKKGILTLACLLVAGALNLQAQPDSGFLLWASTIGPIDSGVVDALETAFERDTGIRVRHVGAGTGAALDIARQGTVDLVLAHARSLEEKFIHDGYGIERVPFMYNDFVIVGPAGDPAGIRGGRDALGAMTSLAAKGAPFVSRGDKSGTHVAEMDLWAKAGIKPAGAWYQVFARGAEGNTATLRFTSEAQAYTVIDRASYLGAKPQIKLDVLVEGDEVLLNHISLIPVSPQKCPRVNAKEAAAFVAWLTDPAKGQALVAAFGKDTFGQALFIPESKAWKARAGVP